MNKLITFITALSFLTGTAFATTHTITTVSTTFSPATTTANVGDTILFEINSIHTATQVSLDTWNANMSTPLDGGFNFSAGSSNNIYVLKPTDVGTIYFVCIPHAAFGMKGMIIVSNPAGIDPLKLTSSALRVYPNVLKESQNISIELDNTNVLDVKVYNINGKEVGSAKADGSKLQLPAAFGRGIFLIRVLGSDNKVYAQKIIVS